MVQVARVLGWGVLACCIPCAGCWLLRLDRSRPGVLLAALVPVALPVAYPVLAGALAARWWYLAAASAALVALHLVYAWSAVISIIAPARRAGPRLTVLTVNVHVGRADPEALAGLIERERPDVVAIQELTPSFCRRLENAGAWARLRFAVTAANPDPMMGAGLWSTRRLAATGLLCADGTRVPAGTLRLGGRPVRVQVAHPLAPVASIQGWKDGLSRLARVARRTDTALVMLGDFNATGAHPAFRLLLAAGMRDAFDARGRILPRTWPADRRFPPPVLALDHVLVKGLAVLDVRVGPDIGSDHLPVIATVAPNR